MISGAETKQERVHGLNERVNTDQMKQSVDLEIEVNTGKLSQNKQRKVNKPSNEWLLGGTELITSTYFESVSQALKLGRRF